MGDNDVNAEDRPAHIYRADRVLYMGTRLSAFGINSDQPYEDTYYGP